MSLPYNHIVNQVVFFEGNGRLRERIARNIDIYGSNSGMSRSIKVQYQKLDELQQEILEENETLVRSFFSVCVFDESEAELEKADKRSGRRSTWPVSGIIFPDMRTWLRCISPASPARST